MADRFLGVRRALYEDLTRAPDDSQAGYVYVVTGWSMRLADTARAFESCRAAAEYADSEEGVVHRLVVWPSDEKESEMNCGWPFCWRCWRDERRAGATRRVAWRVARGRCGD